MGKITYSLKVGYIYAVHDEWRKLIKIGVSVVPHVRLYKLAWELKPKTPFVILGVTEHECIPLAEKALHEFFKTRRVEGEWFKIHPIDVLGKITYKGLWEVSNAYAGMIDGKNIRQRFIAAGMRPMYALPGEKVQINKTRINDIKKQRKMFGIRHPYADRSIYG